MSRPHKQPTRVGTWPTLAQALSSDEDERARVALVGRWYWVRNQLFRRSGWGPSAEGEKKRTSRYEGTSQGASS